MNTFEKIYLEVKKLKKVNPKLMVTLQKKQGQLLK